MMRLNSSHIHHSARWLTSALIPPRYLMTLKALSISCTIQLIMEEEDAEEIQGMLNYVSLPNQVTPEDMAEEQKRDSILGLVCQYVTAGEN